MKQYHWVFFPTDILKIYKVIEDLGGDPAQLKEDPSYLEKLPLGISFIKLPLYIQYAKGKLIQVVVSTDGELFTL